ncbi:hypothetical protein C8F04DRAFT_894827, partial [Mycena alexandri]
AWAAATFVLGPRPRTTLDDEHIMSWSALTALGTYDPRHGGHIILWDLGLLVRFPPGATILLPRALLRYSFVEIGPGETRHLLIQHTPAPVLNLTENGNRTDLEF